MKTNSLTGKELLATILTEVKYASTEELAHIAGELGLYNIISIDSLQDRVTVEVGNDE